MRKLQMVCDDWVTCDELAVCRDYYTQKATGHFMGLSQVGFICRLHGVTPAVLQGLLNRVRVYDKEIRCTDCGVLFLLTEPNQELFHESIVWRCDGCMGFRYPYLAKHEVDDVLPF